MPSAVTNANWSSNPLFPGAADDVIINVAGVQTITHGSGVVVINSLALGSAANPNNSLVVSGFGASFRTLIVNNSVTITAGSLVLDAGILQGSLPNQGTVIQQTGTNGLVFTNNGAILNNVTVRGALTVGDAANPGAFLSIRSGVTLLTEAGTSPGAINVGTVVGATNASVNLDGGQTFNNATINLGNATQSATLGVGGFSTLTLGANTVVQGSGGISGSSNPNLVNAGTISANQNGRTLTVTLGSVTLSNSGVLEARNGGTLTISPFNWTNAGTIRVVDATSTINLGGTFTTTGPNAFNNAAGGTLNLTGTLNNTASTLAFSPATGSMRLDGGRINGGTVQQSGTNGLVFTSNGGTLDNTTFRGTMTLGDAANPNAFVRINNGLTLLTEAGGSPGVMNVSTVAGSGTGVVGFNGTQTFNNATINLGNAASQIGRLSLDTNDTGTGGTFTLGANTVVQGQGTVGAGGVGGGQHLVNTGTISANFSGRTLTINNSGMLTNSGVVEARNGGTLAIIQALTMTNLSGGTLTGGTWRSVGNGSTLTLRSDAISTNAAEIILDGTGSVLHTQSPTTGIITTIDNSLSSNTAAGALRVLNNRNFTVAANSGNFTNSGVLELGGGTFTANSLANTQGAAGSQITGFGTIATPTAVTGNGTVSAAGGTLVIQRGLNDANATAQSNAGGTLSLGTVADATSTVGQLINTGSLNLNANNVTVIKDYNNANFGTGNAFNARSNVVGAGQIIGQNAAMSISGDVAASGANSWTMNVGNVRTVGGSPSANYQIANSGTGADIRGAIQTSVNGGSITDTRLSGSGVTAGNFGPIAAGTSSGNYTVNFSGTPAGALTGQRIAVVSNFSNVATQVINLSGNVFEVAQPSGLPGTVNLGNFRAGTPLSQTVTLTNTNIAPAGFQEGLNATIVGTAGAATGAGALNNVAAGASGNLQIGVTGAAGVNTGTVQVQLASNGAGTSGLGTFNLGGPQTVNVTGTGYRLASTNTQPATINFGNVLVGSIQAQALNIQNTALADGFSERLDARFVAGGTTGAATNNGDSISLLAVGATNNTAMSVGVNTSTIGAKTGQVILGFDSNGSGTSGLGITGLPNQNVGILANVTANVGTLAQPSAVAPNPVNFGNFRVGAPGAGPTNLSISNNGVAGSSEGLNASIATGSAGFAASGAFTSLAGGSTNNSNLQVSFNGTGTAGAKSGAATVTLVSDGTFNGGTTTPLPSQTVNMNANVFNAAQPAGIPANVNVGNFRTTGSPITQTVTLTNTNISPAGFQEGLNASIGAATGAGAGTGSLTNVAAGASGALQVGVAGTAGVNTGSVTVNLASNGAGTSGLATLALPIQTVNVSGTGFVAAAGAILTTALNFGTIQVGQSVSQALQIQNTAGGPSGFVENLNASFGAASGTGAALISGAGAVNGLVAGATNNGAMVVNVNTSAAGTVNGAIAVNFFTAGAVGAVSNGLGVASVGSASYGVQGTIQTVGNVVDQANPRINNAQINLGAARVGDASPTQAISITNLASGNQQAALNATVSAAAPITATGAFNLLAPGATNNSSLVIGMNTSTAGVKSGQANVGLVSDASNIGNCAPNCQLTLAAQQVNVTGNVYQQAQATVQSAVNFGIVHVGDAVANRSVSVQNTAPVAGLNDTLRASIGGTSGPFTNNGGSVAGLTAGGAANASALLVGLNAASAGVFTSTAQVGLLSQNAQMADLNLGNRSVAVSAQVNNYASAVLRELSGAGSLTRVGNVFTLDFGNIAQGAAALFANLATLNDVLGPSDLLEGSYAQTTLGGTFDFLTSGFNPFANLNAGQSQTGLQVGFANTGLLGLFQDEIDLTAFGSNASGYRAELGPIQLFLRANVVTVGTVPEPGSLLLLIAMGGMLWAAQRRRRTLH